MINKSITAYKTISEVVQILGLKSKKGKLRKKRKKRIKKRIVKKLVSKRKKFKKSQVNNLTKKAILKVIRFQDKLNFNFNINLDKSIQSFFQKIANTLYTSPLLYLVCDCNHNVAY